jgi:hypothetical protein
MSEVCSPGVGPQHLTKNGAGSRPKERKWTGDCATPSATHNTAHRPTPPSKARLAAAIPSSIMNIKAPHCDTRDRQDRPPGTPPSKGHVTPPVLAGCRHAMLLAPPSIAWVQRSLRAHDRTSVQCAATSQPPPSRHPRSTGPHPRASHGSSVLRAASATRTIRRYVSWLL